MGRTCYRCHCCRYISSRKIYGGRCTSGHVASKKNLHSSVLRRLYTKSGVVLWLSDGARHQIDKRGKWRHWARIRASTFLRTTPRSAAHQSANRFCFSLYRLTYRVLEDTFRDIFLSLSKSTPSLAGRRSRDLTGRDGLPHLASVTPTFLLNIYGLRHFITDRYNNTFSSTCCYSRPLQSFCHYLLELLGAVSRNRHSL